MSWLLGRESAPIEANRRPLRDEEGTTAVEYAVMLAMILMAMIGTISLIGGETGALWGRSLEELRSVGF
jgi:pilus assembly protein Flp/PilA